MSTQHLDVQAFSSSTADMDGRKLAALYTVQHRLARDAKEPHGVNHRNVPFRYCLDEATPDLIT